MTPDKNCLTDPSIYQNIFLLHLIGIVFVIRKIPDAVSKFLCKTESKIVSSPYIYHEITEITFTNMFFFLINVCMP